MTWMIVLPHLLVAGSLIQPRAWQSSSRDVGASVPAVREETGGVHRRNGVRLPPPTEPTRGTRS